MKLRVIIALALLVVVLLPSTTFAADYEPEEDITLAVAVIDTAGDPVTDATVTVDVHDSDGNLEVDGESVSHIAGGVYGYDWTFPAGEDSYYAVFDVTDHKTVYREYHVVTPPAVGAVWGEAITGYTDSSTFGGLINNITEGGQLPMFVICGVLALGLLAIFFWKNSGVAAYGASGLWLLLGFVSMGQSTSPVFPIQDTYMGLFWMGMIFCMACALLPSVMREKPSKDDIYVDDVDEVTGERIDREGEEKSRQSLLARRQRRKDRRFDKDIQSDKL